MIVNSPRPLPRYQGIFCPFAKIPYDLLKLIFSYLPNDSILPCSRVCRPWRRLLYFKSYQEGQIKGRMRVVTEIYILYSHLDYRNQIKDAMKEGTLYLAGNDCPFEVVCAKLQEIIDFFFAQPSIVITRDQRILERKKSILDLANLSLHHSQQLIDSGIYHSLKSHINMIARHHSADDVKKMFRHRRALTPLVYHIYLRCLAAQKMNYLEMNIPVEANDCKEMRFLAKALPYFNCVKTIKFTNRYQLNRTMSWGGYLCEMKNGLIKMLRLQTLIFSELHDRLNDQDMVCIVEIMRKNQIKKVIFGPHCLERNVNLMSMLSRLPLNGRKFKVVLEEEKMTLYWPPKKI
jgi:hypothetical protein